MEKKIVKIAFMLASNVTGRYMSKNTFLMVAHFIFRFDGSDIKIVSTVCTKFEKAKRKKKQQKNYGRNTHNFT